jgi:hypothetical protein
VLLVETVIFEMGNPVDVQLLGDGMVCPYGSLKHGGITNVKSVSMLFQDDASLLRLIHTKRCQLDILPSGESVEHVVLGFAMTYEYDFVACLRCCFG